MPDQDQRWITLVHTIAARANQARDIDTLFEETLPLVVELCDAVTAWVLLQAPDKSFILAGAYNLPPSLKRDSQATLRWSPCYCEQLLLDGRLKETVSVLQCERLRVLRAKLAIDNSEEMQQLTGNLVLHASVPLRSSGRVMGILNVAPEGERPFAEETQQLLTLVGDILGAAVYRLQEVQLRAWYLEVLNRIIHAAVSTTDVQKLLVEVLDHLLRALNLSIGGIWTYQQAALRRLPPEFGWAIRQVAQETQLDITYPIVVSDWQEVSPEVSWYPLRTIMERHGIRASITVPIQVAELRVGGLSVASETPRDWSPEEQALLSAVAYEVGAAIERLHLFEEAQERARRITQLAALSQSLNQAHSLDEVIGLIVAGARELTHADGVALYVWQRSEGRFRTARHEGLSSTFVTRLEAIPPEELPGGNLAHTPQPVLITNFHTLPAENPLRRLADEEGLVSQAVWPLVYEGKTIAVLGCYYRRQRTWGPLDQEVIDTFARQAAIALRNAQLLADLEQTNAQLRDALQAREDMLRNVTHELRTPLTMIRGYAELMEMGLVSTPAEIQEHARTILRNARHLEHLINQMLLFQRIRQGEPLPVITLDLTRWLEEVVSDWQYPMQETGLELRLEVKEPLPLVQAHPDYLRQVMDNLLDNARKFSPQGGVVTVRAWRESSWVYIAVKDQGVGIPPDKLEHIFERFYQVDSSPTRRFGGMGLGLALAKEIVTLHGGRIWAESPGEGRGTTVIFTLPVS